MRTFDVHDCKVDIIQPKILLAEWARQNNPYCLCNASLYVFATREPIGTIIEHNKIIHNDGNGYGYGIINGQPGFGGPWDTNWSEYLTGYNSPIQNGKYVAPTFSDSYVFDVPNTRIGIGEKNGRLTIITDDNVTLKQFAEHALSSGVTTLVNLDGGGSRHLFYSGQTIYRSVRIPYNALVFYKDYDSIIPTKDECPFSEPIRNLFYGSRGEDVKWLQWHLNNKGYKCVVDGKFYYETLQAIWQFQKTWSKHPDGICGPNTRRELLK